MALTFSRNFVQTQGFDVSHFTLSKPWSCVCIQTFHGYDTEECSHSRDQSETRYSRAVYSCASIDIDKLVVRIFWNRVTIVIMPSCLGRFSSSQARFRSLRLTNKVFPVKQVDRRHNFPSDSAKVVFVLNLASSSNWLSLWIQVVPKLCLNSIYLVFFFEVMSTLGLTRLI